MASEREEKIKSRAYAIWEREGRPHGRDRAHWAQAAREVDSENPAPADASQGIKVTAYNDPTRSGGPVEGRPHPSGSSGVSSGLQPGGARPGGGPATTRGSVGTGGGSTAGRATGSSPSRKE
jgi:hypothetical protein